MYMYAWAMDMKLSQSVVNRSYLGRPWKNYSRTIFVDSYMESIVAPEGWMSWLGAQPPDTLYYAEFRNRGPGSATAHRVNWTGVHQFNDSNEVSPFLPNAFISSSSWLPETTFQYYDGLRSGPVPGN